MEKVFGILLLVVLGAIGFQHCRDAYFSRRTEVVVTRQRGVAMAPPPAPVADECGIAPEILLRDAFGERSLADDRIAYDEYEVTIRTAYPFVPAEGSIAAYGESHGSRENPTNFTRGSVAHVWFSFVPHDMPAAAHNNRDVATWLACEHLFRHAPAISARLRVPRGMTIGFTSIVHAYDVTAGPNVPLTTFVTGTLDGQCATQVELHARAMDSGVETTLRPVLFGQYPRHGDPGDRIDACILHVIGTPMPCGYGFLPGRGSCVPDVLGARELRARHQASR